MWILLVAIASFGVVGDGTFEPNDDIANATDLGILQPGVTSVTGAVLGDGPNPNHDVDLYRFEVSAEALPLHINAAVFGSPPVDAYLRLFDADGHELWANDDASAETVLPRLVTLLLDPGVYYLGTSSAANRAYSAVATTMGPEGDTGAYEVSLELIAVEPPVPTGEPNDDFDSAVAVSSPSTTSGFIGDGPNGRRDVDVYRVAVVEPVVMSVTAHAPDGSPLDVAIGAWGNWERLAFADDQSSTDTSAFMQLVIPEAMEVFIFVGGSPEAVRDPFFERTLAGSVGAYELNISATPIDVGLEGGDVNDSFLLAELLPLFIPDSDDRPETIEIEGTIGDGPYGSTRGDRDLFEVKIAFASRFLSLTATPVAGGALDPVLAYFDPDGHLVAFDDNGGEGLGARLVLPTACVTPSYYTDGGVVMVAGAGQRFLRELRLPWPGEHHFNSYQVGGGPGSTGDYVLTVSIAGDPPSCVAEPDNTLATAQVTGIVGSGVFLCNQGRLDDSQCADPLDDKDVFSFRVTDVPAMVRVTLFADCSQDEKFYYSARVVDVAGITVGSSIGVLDYGSRAFEVRVDAPGQYYAAVDSDQFSEFDPFDPCALNSFRGGAYGLSIEVKSAAANDGTTQAWPPDVDASQLVEADGRFTYASSYGNGPVIDEIDIETGAVSGSLPSPTDFSGAEGLAVHGDTLLVLGAGWSPVIYRLSLDDGEVIESRILTAGSGMYSDAVVIGSELFVLDIVERSIHVYDADNFVFKRSLSLRGLGLSGAMAALAGPARLLLAGDLATGGVAFVDPRRGRETGTVDFEPGVAALAGFGKDRVWATAWDELGIIEADRDGNVIDNFDLGVHPLTMASVATAGSFGDLDQDGDVDLRDAALFAPCMGESAGPPFCERADTNDDGTVDLLDHAGLAALQSGP